MIELYKIINSIHDPIMSNFMKTKRSSEQTCILRRHNKTILHQNCRSNIRINSFTLRIIKTWNELPSNIVNATSNNGFKNTLNLVWANKELLYKYKADR